MLTLLAIIIINAPAYAQNESQPTLLPSQGSAIDQLLNPEQKDADTGAEIDKYKDIPDSYIDEVLSFNQRCETDPILHTYYECECLSMAVLDSRIESGPSRSQNSILLSLKQVCKDGTHAAGAEYQNCMQNGSLNFPRNKAPEEYCACIGNEMAKIYETSNAAPGSSAFKNIRPEAYSRCQ